MIDKLKKSLPELRSAFINCHLPIPTYTKDKQNKSNVVCHIRMGDAIGTRILDNNSIFEFINKFDSSYNIIIHTQHNQIIKQNHHHGILQCIDETRETTRDGAVCSAGNLYNV